MDPEVVRKSLASIHATPARVAGDFYGYLFAAHPELRQMFPPQMAAQNERLFAALLRIAGLLDDPQALAGYLGQLGADHRKYGVQPEHYGWVGDALLCALRRHSLVWGDVEEGAWRAAFTTAADAMIAGAAAAAGPAWWNGQVIRHERRGADLAVLTVRTGEPLPYLAGQYVTVQHQRWPRVWRPFSVATAPGGDGDLELHVRAVPGGWVSTAMVRDTAPGDELVVGPAAGAMTSAGVGDRDLVCIAGGTGLAPVKAVTEAVLAAAEDAVADGTSTRRNVHLFHGARTPPDLYAMPELNDLQRRFPWLHVVPVVSDVPRFEGRCGPVADVALEEDWPDRDVLIAGPAAMTRDAVHGCLRAGIAADRIHLDELGVSVSGAVLGFPGRGLRGAVPIGGGPGR